MKKRLLACIILSIGLLGLSINGASALVLNDWSNSYLLRGTGVENPILRFGFNPQPEPPAYHPPEPGLDMSDSLMPTVNAYANEGDLLRLVFGISSNQPLSLVNSGTALIGGDVAPIWDLSLDAINETGEVLYHIAFDLYTESGGKPTSFVDWVGFNPQPEPPALGLGDGADFGYANMNFTSYSIASAALAIWDNQGNQLTFSRVPEPAPLALMILGLSGLIWFRKVSRGRLV